MFKYLFLCFQLSKSTFDPKSSPEDTSEKSRDDSISSLPTESTKINYSLDTNSEEEVNPWLQTDSFQVISSSKKNNNVKENNKSDKIVSKLKKQKDRSQSQNGIEIDVNKVLTIGSVQMTGKFLNAISFFFNRLLNIFSFEYCYLKVKIMKISKRRKELIQQLYKVIKLQMKN